MSTQDPATSLWDPRNEGSLYLRDGETMSELYHILGFPDNTHHRFEKVCLDHIRQFQYRKNGVIIPTRDLVYAHHKDGVRLMTDSLLNNKGVGRRFWGIGSPDKVDDDLVWERDRRL